MTTRNPKHLPVGLHAVEAPCPNCGVLELIWVTLSTVLTSPSDADATLKVKAASKPVVHLCGQETIEDLFGASDTSEHSR